MKSTFTALLLCRLLLAPAFASLNGIEAYYRKAMEEWQVPGFAAAVIRDGQPLLVKGFGARELGKPEKVDEHTVFAIASNTKAFTAAGIARLVYQKRLRWDDRVQQHLPWFEIFQDPWISRETRLEDLLCHRTGFRTYSGDLIWWNTPYSASEVVRRARFLKPQFGFRRGYGYSNIMLVAAGEVIAAVSGRPWTDFTRDEILEPLGMKDTILSPKELSGKSNAATPHGNDEEGKPYAIARQAWDSVSAAGGVISSAADLSRWLQLQLGEGTFEDRTYWSPNETWKMWSLHNPMPLRKDSPNPETSLNGAGLGWFVADYQGEFIVQHGGAYDGMFSHTVLAPKRKASVVILSNSMTDMPRALAFYTLDRLLDKPERDWSAERLDKAAKDRAEKAKATDEKSARRVPDTKPSLPITKYVGTYGGEMYGDARITLEDGKLTLQLLPNPELEGELVHWHHDVFELRWKKRFAWFGNGHVQFLLNADSEITEFKMDVPNEDFWFDELEFEKR